MLAIKLIQIAFFLGCYTNVTAQNSDSYKIRLLDSLFNGLYTSKKSMGGICIYKNGKEFYSKNYGIVNTSGKKATPETKYRIASISKIFTAYLIMQMVKENKISLDDKLSKYFVQIKNSDSVTIYNMLSHTSILPVYTKSGDLEKLRKAKTIDELINIINQQEFILENVKYKYNNLNYILLGLIIEKIGNKPYNYILNESVKGLSNENAIYGLNKQIDADNNEAKSFYFENDVWKEEEEITPTPISDGSGFLVCTAKFLTNFMNKLFDGYLLDTNMLVKMLPGSDKKGLGFMKTDFGTHIGYGHSGRIENFTCATTIFPQDKISISFLQNATVYPLNDILLLIGDILFNDTVEIPNFKEIMITSDDKNKITGEYINEEEGYKIFVDIKKNEIRLRVKNTKSPFKMILPVVALTSSRLFFLKQGVFFDFSGLAEGKYSKCTMKVNGAKLLLTRTK